MYSTILVSASHSKIKPKQPKLNKMMGRLLQMMVPQPTQEQAKIQIPSKYNWYLGEDNVRHETCRRHLTMMRAEALRLRNIYAAEEALSREVSDAHGR